MPRVEYTSPVVRVSNRGAARWTRGHPWIYRSDTLDHPGLPGIVRAEDEGGRFLGQALYSAESEISLRLLESTDRPIDTAWWVEQLSACLARRHTIDATACRLVHGEGDGLPSLVVDRYDRWVVCQLLSAGLETCRADVLAAVDAVLAPEGVLLRHDAAVRRRERLPAEIVVAAGQVPERIEVREGSVRCVVAPRTGQKTGAFLDQRENRIRLAAGARPGGRALDCFAYQGWFALHLAARAAEVVALDTSEDALGLGRASAELNGRTNIRWQTADAFEALRAMDQAGERFDTVVVDPPAFARTRAALGAALRGYHEVNRRAMRLLAPGGLLLTASCSYHIQRSAFETMVASAATDAGRRLTVLARLGQASDHPELLTIPETGYLKGLLLQAR